MKYFMIVLSVVFLLLSCGQTVRTYDLSQMPEYSFDEYFKEYATIQEAEVMYQQLIYNLIILANSDIKISKNATREISIKIDEYLWWRSVATTQGFYGEYDKMRESIEKGKDALLAARDIAIEAVKKAVGTEL